MIAPVVLDKSRVRRHFDRAAPSYDAAAALQREVAARLLERLDLVRLQPGRVADLGSGTGILARALQERYPRAFTVAVDLSPGMLRAGHRRTWRSLLGRTGPRPVCGDMERLPLAGSALDLACSSLALAWCSDPSLALAEAHRVLARGGLFMFATLGPDSLQELRAALGPGASTVHPFLDMHDLGDLLVKVGFADPVMEMERITLTYPTLRALLAELKAAGGASSARHRPRALKGREWLTRLEAAYGQDSRDGRFPLTFEIVYGHAWKPETGPRRTPEGHAVVHVERPARPRGERR